jgi:hypothetical protein
LKTDVFSFAKIRLIEKTSKIGRIRSSKDDVESGNGTMADLFAA